MAETLEELRSLSDEELMRRHDRHAASVQVATKHYLDELARRDSVRTAQRMLDLTERLADLTAQLRWMTAVVTAATVAALVVAVVSLLVALFFPAPAPP